jgi:hypothetical protein
MRAWKLGAALVPIALALSCTAAPAEAAPASSCTTNWSGYVAVGHQYTEASGTFVVPKVGYSPGATASEWVGIGGWASSAGLIQAGVNEIPVGPGSTLNEPWWEEPPAPQQFASGVMVHSGDRISVGIAEIRGGRWSISLVDHTDGDSYRTTVPYDGPATSAEWILEADGSGGGGQTSLAPPAGPVTFAGITSDPPADQPTKVSMAQAGRVVATPSAFFGSHFAIFGPNVT